MLQILPVMCNGHYRNLLLYTCMYICNLETKILVCNKTVDDFKLHKRVKYHNFHSRLVYFCQTSLLGQHI